VFGGDMSVFRHCVLLLLLTLVAAASAQARALSIGALVRGGLGYPRSARAHTPGRSDIAGGRDVVAPVHVYSADGSRQRSFGGGVRVAPDRPSSTYLTPTPLAASQRGNVILVWNRETPVDRGSLNPGGHAAAPRPLRCSKNSRWYERGLKPICGRGSDEPMDMRLSGTMKRA